MSHFLRNHPRKQMDLQRSSTPLPAPCLTRTSSKCGPNCPCCAQYRKFVENHRNPRKFRRVYRVKGVERVARNGFLAGNLTFKCSRKYFSVKNFVIELKRRFFENLSRIRSRNNV